MKHQAFKPLKRTTIAPPTEAQIAAAIRSAVKSFGLTPEQAERDVRAGYEADMECEAWHSEQYFVLVTRETQVGENWPKMDWLSIRRQDRAPVRDWRHMQAIKNQLCGPEREGVELYPAESRLVDTANQFHLFVFCEEGLKLPFGFTQRAVTDELDPAMGAKQRARSTKGRR